MHIKVPGNHECCFKFEISAKGACDDVYVVGYQNQLDALLYAIEQFCLHYKTVPQDIMYIDAAAVGNSGRPFNKLSFEPYTFPPDYDPFREFEI